MDQQLVKKDFLKNRLAEVKGELSQKVAKENTFNLVWLSSKGSQKTKTRYMKVIKDFLQFNNNTLLKEITVHDVSSFLHGYYEGLSLATRSQARGVLSSLFTNLVDVGYMNKNPAKLTTRIKYPEDILSKTMSREELKRVINYPKKLRDRLLLETLYFTGLRVSELTNLKWTDFKEENEVVKISIIGKGSKFRIVQVPFELFSRLRVLKAEDSEYVFESQMGKNSKLRSDSVYKLVRKAGQESIGRSISPHWFRHQFATDGLKNGSSLRLLQESLGHSSPATTAKYAHISRNDFSGKFLNLEE
jgi:integrase/recombinase XerD